MAKKDPKTSRELHLHSAEQIMNEWILSTVKDNE